MRRLILLLTLFFAAPVGAQMNDEGAEIARAIKEAEREGYEHHELARHLAVYADDAVFVKGRREAPDAYDLRFDHETMANRLARQYREPLSGEERIYFRNVKVEVTGDQATMTAEVAQHFFGGRDELLARFEVARTDAGWRVKAVRTWPTAQQIGPDIKRFSDTFWLEADKRAETNLTDETSSLYTRLATLLEARWTMRAYQEACAATERRPTDTEAWLARARLALEVGALADVDKAAARLMKLAPRQDLPRALRPLADKGASKP
ncbi:MAG: hypothetical protein KC620_05810 [Myxococcales bacterium]|nr:hypothetical protein [Myxococcales bacterium]